jgi:hypothetical protein
VKSSATRSCQHLTKAPLPFLWYCKCHHHDDAAIAKVELQYYVSVAQSRRRDAPTH